MEIAFSRLGRKPGSPSRKLPSGWDQEQPRAYSANYGVIALDIDAGTYRLVTSTTGRDSLAIYRSMVMEIHQQCGNALVKKLVCNKPMKRGSSFCSWIDTMRLCDI